LNFGAFFTRKPNLRDNHEKSTGFYEKREGFADFQDIIAGKIFSLKAFFIK
jgi:hypothetical protein